MQKNIKSVEEKLGYTFKRLDYLSRALTHSSYANENKKERIKNNERLEFLGDSVLGMIVSEYLFTHYSNLEEGQLTKMRARIVCEASLSEAARQLDLGPHMFFGRGEELTGGRERTSILSDAFEAVVAAIYLDGGFDAATHFVLTHLKPLMENAAQGRIFTDYKTKLQEVIQVKKGNRIRYEVFKEEGPDHSKMFFTRVKLNEDIIGVGIGRSKKEAEQMAAKEGLEKLTHGVSD